jgi:hypothetical protein
MKSQSPDAYRQNIITREVMVFLISFSDGEVKGYGWTQEPPQEMMSAPMKKTCYQAVLVK